MKLYYESKKKDFKAEAEFDSERKEFVVKKGSKVSSDVGQSEKFRGGKSVLKSREKYVRDRIVTEDVMFNSPSTAANFISGRSSNGMIAWKNSEGVKLGDILKNK